MEKELEKIIAMVRANTYREELADQYIRELLDEDKLYE